MPRLLVSKSQNRVNPAGPPRGDKARGRRDKTEQDDRGSRDSWVMGLDSIQLRRYVAAKTERGWDAYGETDPEER